MTPEERFVFDVHGYLIIPGVLDVAEVSQLNRLFDAAYPGDYDHTTDPDRRLISRWGKPFLDLMDHSRVLPYLLELVGPKLRVDHDYCIVMDKGQSRGTLHGGPWGWEPDHWYKYHDGVIRTGLTVATFFLTPAAEGDGGFSCVPGSHKSNFTSGIPPEVATFQRPAAYVRQPAVEAGDVLIFTEALVHGTAPWQAQHQRRVLLYKYSPGHSAWAGRYYDPAAYPDLSEQQRRMMLPPMIGDRPDTVPTGADA